MGKKKAAEPESVDEVLLRPARTADVVQIRQLVDTFSPDRRLLSKATVALYEDVQEFVVAELDDNVVGCGALHCMWEDLAEVRTLAVDPEALGRGIGSLILEELLDRARTIGVKRVFVLTFEVEFFRRYGFVEIEGTPVEHDVFEQLLQSYDEGVAEFLDLERVKPNTLGNSRLLLIL
ncbi:MAG: amino-acid N-acetyltransferase [Candidatus Nanopelagicales bacterium]